MSTTEPKPHQPTPVANLTRVGLGTAQFGLDYGISNPDGQISLDEAERILAHARQNGMEIIDTAAAYGNSEEVLGQVFPSKHDFKIVTKIERLDMSLPSDRIVSEVKEGLRKSLADLRVESVYGLLVHNAADLTSAHGDLLYETLAGFKRDGLVSRIGASVYTGDQIDVLMERFDLDLVQLPINLFDQRLIRSGHLDKLKAAGIEVHARSVFLQGLLLMEANELPSHLKGAIPLLRAFRSGCAGRDRTALEEAIGFVLSLSQIDCAILGVCDVGQLEEISRAAGKTLPDPDSFAEYAVDNEDIIDPSKWEIEEHENRS